MLPLTKIPDLGNKLENALNSNMENATEFFNIFDSCGSTQGGRAGYWPIFNPSTGDTTGVIHMELQTFTAAQAEENLGCEGNESVTENQNPRLTKPDRPSNRGKKILKFFGFLAAALLLIGAVVFVVNAEQQYLTMSAKSAAFPTLQDISPA